MSPVFAFPSPVTCPDHGRPVSGGPVIYRCDAGRLGHRVQAADLEVAAEGRWQDRARCAETDPDAFFPEFGESTRQAEKVCAGCEVRDECLEYALENREMYGVWGGVPEHERHQLHRARAKDVFGEVDISDEGTVFPEDVEIIREAS